MSSEEKKKLRDELAYIVADNLDFTTEIIDGDEIYRCHPKPLSMIKALQKLFLSKQIELLEESLRNTRMMTMGKIVELQSELKSLE